MTERPARTEMPNVIELSVVNKFRREIWTKFLKGIKEYQLIQEGDKIAVCISGGIKTLLKQLRVVNPAVDKNIFRSVENVNLQTIISYHRGDDYHHFLDDYDEGRSIRGTDAEGENDTDLS